MTIYNLSDRVKVNLGNEEKENWISGEITKIDCQKVYVAVDFSDVVLIAPLDVLYRDDE